MIVAIKTLVRPKRSARMPNVIPPMAQPMRKIEKMMPPYQPICSVVGGPLAECEQIVQRRMQHDGINRRVHRIEDPSKPGDEQDQPLVAGDAGRHHRVLVGKIEFRIKLTR